MKLQCWSVYLLLVVQLYVLVPLDNLSVGVVVTGTALGQVVGVHETTKRVTTLSKTVNTCYQDAT